jgi:hypothetical protein
MTAAMKRGGGVAAMAGLVGETLSRSRAAALSTIAADLLGGLRAPGGPAWLQRRWGADVELVLQHRRDEGRWRLAATLTSGAAPDGETLALLAVAFGQPADAEWRGGAAGTGWAVGGAGV